MSTSIAIKMPDAAGAAVLAASFVLLLSPLDTARAEAELGGHGKLRLIANALPSDSVLRDFSPSVPLDAEGEFRLDGRFAGGRWRVDAAYTLFALEGDRVDYSRAIAGRVNRFPDDERRLFDLTHVFSDAGNSLSLHRLDRLSLTYSSEDLVVRLGRQVLSWGNGLFFSPLDLVNPFDPAAIDTEFKVGDDMLYVQRLLETGNDLQAALVVRRDPLTGNVREDVGSALVKYHAFIGDRELDLLFGRHYGELVMGAGIAGSVGGAVVRGDLLLSDAEGEPTTQLVANVSYSWIALGRNMTGSAEYFFSGFGQRADRYAPGELASNPALTDRLARGELFSLGRHYTAASVGIEVTPLLTVSPTLFANLSDRSTLLQIIAQYSLSDESTLLGSLNLPLGPSGTEYGGIPAPQDGRFFSFGPGVFLQLAGYF